MHQRDVAALNKFLAIYKEYRRVPVPKFPSCNCDAAGKQQRFVTIRDFMSTRLAFSPANLSPSRWGAGSFAFAATAG